MGAPAATVGAPRARGRLHAAVWRWTHRAFNLVCFVLVMGLVAIGAAQPLGFQVRVDHSDSMLPAIAAGDVLVTRVVRPSELRAGDVVSFNSPDRRGIVITHRVVSRRMRAGRYEFVTKGDANTGVERWTVSTRGKVGRMAFRIPRAGYALAWVGGKQGRIVFVLGGGIVLAGLLARRIWRM
jgi:signal peptidase